MTNVYTSTGSVDELWKKAGGECAIPYQNLTGEAFVLLKALPRLGPLPGILECCPLSIQRRAKRLAHICAFSRILPIRKEGCLFVCEGMFMECVAELKKYLSERQQCVDVIYDIIEHFEQREREIAVMIAPLICFGYGPLLEILRCPACGKKLEGKWRMEKGADGVPFRARCHLYCSKDCGWMM